MTAERRADKAESGTGTSEDAREGEVDRRGEEAGPRISGISGVPELSWSASEDDSPSDNTV